MKNRALWLCGSALAACAASAQPAAAQVAVPDKNSGIIEEVIVTARKREESLQTVPVAVSAIQGEQLARQGLVRVSDVALVVPSLNIRADSANDPSGLYISLRGQVTSDVTVTLSTPVGLYEDGVNIPHAQSANLGFFDISRVEVLKGPQGTLYGRNTTGGAFNIFTKDADYDGVHGYMSVEAGEYEQRKINGAVNVPLVEDKLALRLAAQYWKREGYGRSALSGQRYGGVHNDRNVRLSVRFDPTPSVTGKLKVEYGEVDITDSMFHVLKLLTGGAVGPGIDTQWRLEGRVGGVPPSVLVANNVRDDIFTNYSNTNSFLKVQAWHAVADETWDIADNLSVRSITGYHQFINKRVFDLAGLPAAVSVISAGYSPLPAGLTGPGVLKPIQKSAQFTQELNVSGRLADGRLDWLVGAFYSHDRAQGAQTASTLPNLFGATFNYDAPRVINRSAAIFTQNDYKFTDRLSVTIGGRYTDEKLSLQEAQYYYNVAGSTPSFFFPAGLRGPYLCNAGPVGVLSTYRASEDGCFYYQSVKTTGYSYLLSLNGQITPDVLVYAKTSRGTRGSAFQFYSYGPPLDPEISTDYELGLKGEFFDRRLRTNFAAYTTDYKDKQETAYVTNGIQVLSQIIGAQARIRGFEAEAVARPTRGLTLNGSLTYTHTEYLDYPNAPLPQNTGSINLKGQPFNTLPKWAYNIGVQYMLSDVGPGDIRASIGYAWRGRYPLTSVNDFSVPLANGSIPRDLLLWIKRPIGLVNASIGYELPRNGLTFVVAVTNLTDEHYVDPNNGIATSYGYPSTVQAPRMWSVSVRKAFGRE